MYVRIFSFHCKMCRTSITLRDSVGPLIGAKEMTSCLRGGRSPTAPPPHQTKRSVQNSHKPGCKSAFYSLKETSMHNRTVAYEACSVHVSQTKISKEKKQDRWT